MGTTVWMLVMLAAAVFCFLDGGLVYTLQAAVEKNMGKRHTLGKLRMWCSISLVNSAVTIGLMVVYNILMLTTSAREIGIWAIVSSFFVAYAVFGKSLRFLAVLSFSRWLTRHWEFGANEFRTRE